MRACPTRVCFQYIEGIARRAERSRIDVGRYIMCHFHHAQVPAYPYKIYGKEHILHPVSMHSRFLVNKKRSSACCQLRSSRQSFLPLLLGIEDLHEKNCVANLNGSLGNILLDT